MTVINMNSKSPDRFADITFPTMEASFKVIKPLHFHASYKNDAQHFENAARFLGNFSVRHVVSKWIYQQWIIRACSGITWSYCYVSLSDIGYPRLSYFYNAWWQLRVWICSVLFSWMERGVIPRKTTSKSDCYTDLY